MAPRTALGLAALALTSLLGAACGSTSDEGADLVVVAARDLGPLETNAAIRSRDGGYSARVFGRSVWAYGDSILDFEGEDGSAWRNNTASWTPDDDASDGVSGFTERVDGLGAPYEWLPRTAEEAAFNDANAPARWALWPAALVADDARSRALAFYMKVYAEPGDFNFQSVGMGVALWEGLALDPVRPPVGHVPAHPTLLFDGDDPTFGSAAVVVEEWLYVFGVRDLGKVGFLARVPLATVTDRATWTFWTGEGWSPDVAAAVGVLRGADIMSVHWNAHLGRWLAIHGEPLTNRVLLRTAANLTGPWSGATVAFTALAPSEPDTWAYSALGHAEMQRDGGRIEYVTYYRTTGPFAGETRLVELELE